jgi:DNA-binding SARP family transcriptional activator
VTTSHTRAHPPARRRGRIWAATHLVGQLGQALVASAVLVGLIAALPWALGHYIGWPLPDHLPTATQVRAVLLGPMNTLLLLDLLACLCWITWAAFVIDVARCVVAATRGLRWPELPTRGPVHAIAAILVGVIVVSLLGNRSPVTATTGLSEATSAHGQTVATAPATNLPSVLAGPITLVHNTIRAADTDSQDVPSVVVRAPHNGIHDSLSRIAARTLGDAARWPEIYTLNRGKPQPNGGQFTNPNLIFPGERLTLPTPTAPPASAVTGIKSHAALPTGPPPQRPAPPMSIPAPPTTSPHRSSAASRTAPAPDRFPAPQTDPHPGFRHGITWESGVFVGLGLTAAISAALVTARRRYRRRYQPGSGRRDDLPVAPVVYQLRLAHLRADHDGACPDPESEDDEQDRAPLGPLVIGEDPHSQPDRDGVTTATPALGVRQGREIALDLAVTRGLGLVGAGACSAARALLLSLLTTPSASATTARVIIPADDLPLVLGPEHAHHDWAAALRVVADLDAALDELEAEMLRRVRENDSGAQGAWPVLALMARPPERNTQRVQAMLDNGAPFGLVGVLLGQWRPGLSAYVRHDGTVSSTSPGPGQALVGTRLFHLPETQTADLLQLLRQAQTDIPDSTPSIRPRSHGDRDEVINTALELTAIPHAKRADASSSSVRAAVCGPQPSPRQPTKHATAAADHTARDDAVATPITLTVLGRPRLHWTPTNTSDDGAPMEITTEITAAFPPRQRELLVFLALHPDGVHRDTLVAALWHDNPPQRPTNALNTTLSRLRHAVSQATNGALSDLITTGESRYQLDPHLVTVDYWRLADAVAARRAASSESERLAAYQRIVEGYPGCLAEGLDTEWIEAPREAIRRDALDAVAALARALVDTNPQKTLDLLETARAFDPHNELLYRDIMRLQQRLGHLDAIPRTLALLSTRLAEIEEAPTAQTLDLATRLQWRPDSKHPIPGVPGRHDHRGERSDTAAVH